MHNGQRLPIREPIFSVQQQSYFHVREKEQLICKSNHSDQCYRHYLGRHLAIGFGQLREVEYEKVEFSKPSLVILSPTLEIDEIEIVKRTDKLVSSLEQMKQYRKRYAIVHADQNSYIIGGYVFDPLHRVRLSYVNDYKYDAKTGALQPMVPLPTLAVGFGLAIDGKYIVSIGGHTPDNRALSQCHIMNIKVLPEQWTSLPDLPVPTSGPGVGLLDGEIHVIGGFDILSAESITHGDYYRLSWSTDDQWRQQTSLEPIRARTLVLSIPRDDAPLGRLIYAAGGYDVTIKGHPVVVPTVHLYDEEKKNWKLITIIHHLKLSHALSFYDDKLHISELILKGHEEYDNQIIRSYDFKSNQWIEPAKK